MKKHKWSIVLSAVVVLGVVAWSPGTSEDLFIGSNSTTQLTSDTGVLGVVGTGNKGDARSTFIAGENNEITVGGSTLSSIIAGTGNKLEGTNSRNFVTGSGNTVTATTTFVAGNTNTVAGPILGSVTNYSSAIGALNKITSGTGWATGWTNEITGDKSAALGSALRVNQPNSVAVGAWNSDMSAGDVFVVGNGGSGTTRSTALRITSNKEVSLSGKVFLTEIQGDITMGDYQ
jgi:hypothetical protein